MVDTVLTEAELLTLFRDGQGNQQLSAQDMRDYIVSAKYLNGMGWEFHLDGQYTVGSPRALTAGVGGPLNDGRHQITIDGAFGDFGHPSVGHTNGHFWSTATNQVNATALNHFAIGRVSFTAYSDSDTTNKFEFEIDVTAGSFPVIFQETGVFAKGAGVANEQTFNFTIPLFVGPEFLANGAKGFITPESDATFHTFAITIARVYIARP